MNTAPIITATFAFATGVMFASLFFGRQVRRLKNARQLLSGALRCGAGRDERLPRPVQIGTKLTTSADETSKTARAVGELVWERAQPEAAAVAVVVRASQKAEPRLEYCSGIPERRIRESLLSFFEALQDAGGDVSWGTFLPQSGTLHDFRIFGIGSMLAVPIASSAGVRGMIWLGFGVKQMTLPNEKLQFLNDVCEHCSAAFATAEKVQERLVQRERERDILLGMSHDLRAPGNSALYALRDLISEAAGSLSTEQRLRLRIVEDCLEDQLDMLSDIIDYTRYQRGLLKPTRQPVHLREILPRLFDWFRTQAVQHGLTFEVEEIPAALALLDPRHFKRIVANLLANAIKYTDGGFIRITFQLDADTVRLSFGDSGRGIPEQERKFLFQEFSRLSSASGKQGSGLGLVIARELARANGGELRYHPAENGGSIFELEIPRAHAEANLHGQNTPLVSRILVVDDDAAACRTNGRFLRSLAAVVLTATNSSEALRLLAEEKPEVLVSDFNLGATSAETLIRYLREQKQKTCTVVLTGSDERNGLNQYETDLPIHWLSKPAGREALQTAVRKVIGGTFSF